MNNFFFNDPQEGFQEMRGHVAGVTVNQGTRNTELVKSVHSTLRLF